MQHFDRTGCSWRDEAPVDSGRPTDCFLYSILVYITNRDLLHVMSNGSQAHRLAFPRPPRMRSRDVSNPSPSTSTVLLGLGKTVPQLQSWCILLGLIMTTAFSRALMSFQLTLVKHYCRSPRSLTCSRRMNEAQWQETRLMEM